MPMLLPEFDSVIVPELEKVSSLSIPVPLVFDTATVPELERAASFRIPVLPAFDIVIVPEFEKVLELELTMPMLPSVFDNLIVPPEPFVRVAPEEVTTP